MEVTMSEKADQEMDEVRVLVEKQEMLRRSVETAISAMGAVTKFKLPVTDDMVTLLNESVHRLLESIRTIKIN
jgi:hypothetical protein